MAKLNLLLKVIILMKSRSTQEGYRVLTMPMAFVACRISKSRILQVVLDTERGQILNLKGVLLCRPPSSPAFF